MPLGGENYWKYSDASFAALSSMNRYEAMNADGVGGPLPGLGLGRQ